MTATKWNRSDRTAEQERRSSGKRRNCCFGRNHFLFCCCFNSLSAHSCVSYRKKEVHRGMATSGTKQDAFNPPTVGRTGGEVEQKAKELSFPSWAESGFLHQFNEKRQVGGLPLRTLWYNRIYLIYEEKYLWQNLLRFSEWGVDMASLT